MGAMSLWKLLLVAAVVALVFGSRRLPELGKGLGQGLANFRKALRETETRDEGEKGPAPPPKIES